MLKKCCNAAQGDPTSAVKARWIPKPVHLTTSIDPECVDKQVNTLKRILMNDKTRFDNGFDLINTYVEQNISRNAKIYGYQSV